MSRRFPANPAYLGLTALLCVIAGTLSGTVIGQVRTIVSGWDEPVDRRVFQDVYRQIPARPHIPAVRRAVAAALEGRAVPPEQRAVDRGNGLYAWLDLLVGLRAAATRPEADAETATLLDRLRDAGPAKLYLQEERRWLADLYIARGVPVRQAWPLADWASEMFPPLRRAHRPVVRELCDRLSGYADRRLAAGDSEAAHEARRAAVRLLTELVRDSPTPEVVLLACERLPVFLEGLAATEARARVAAFRAAWHAGAKRDRLNLLPRSGDYALAERAQDRVLRSLACSLVCGMSLAVWLVVLPALWALRFWTARAPVLMGEGVVDGWCERFLWTAAGAACLPVAAAVSWLGLGDVPFSWLASLPTLRSAMLLPVTASAMVPAGTLLLPWPERVGAGPGRRLKAACVAALAAGLLAAAVSSAGAPAGEGVPGDIRALRWVFLLSGWGGAALLAGGVVLAIGRLGAARAWAGMLSLACRGTVLLAVLTVASLAANTALDAAHIRAFAAAAADPVSDRLGADWFDRFFEAARRVAAG